MWTHPCVFFNLIIAMFGPLLIVRFEQQHNIKRYSGFHWPKLVVVMFGARAFAGC